MSYEYLPPVSRLLSYGDPVTDKIADWPDYGSELGLTTEHVPELVELMYDFPLADFDPDDPPPLPEGADPEVVWAAPVHAWRAIYQLAPLQLFDERLVSLLETNLEEWIGEDLVVMIPAIGPDAIEPVEQLLAENLTLDTQLTYFIESLHRLPEHYPETRDRIVAILMRFLENYPQQTETNNSFLVLGLVELKATEAADLLEKVYAEEEIVDEFLVGSWPQVQVELGLKAESDFTKEELRPAVPPGLQAVSEMIETWQRRQKPDAFTTGMPIDYGALPSTKPPGFEDMVSSKQPTAPKSNKGFGGSASQGKKNKKGKKKKR